ncbi:hypothetical protein ACQ4LE_007576 [Meloidogyne hapla]|uniref:Heat shock 70 kDa protein 14 n=1 Tax=Meloidogyne hapla TaxID=6305 RepID=A0A1I8B0F7_MELHA
MDGPIGALVESDAIRDPIIAVKFGYSNTSVAVVSNGRPKILDNFGSLTTPSVVAFSGTGGGLVGVPVLQRIFVDSRNTIFGFKRLIGQQFHDANLQNYINNVPFNVVDFNGDVCVEVFGTIYTPSQIISFVVKEMKKIAENHFRNKFARDVVITIPPYFDKLQRQELKESFQHANLRVVDIIDEPTAAALAYGLEKPLVKTVAVYHLGGGPFNISILVKNSKGAFEIKSTSDSNVVMGEDFDNALVNYLVGIFQQLHGIDLTADTVAMQRVRQAAVDAKCELSSRTQTLVFIHNIAIDVNGPKNMFIELTRPIFERLTIDLINRTIEPCRIVMQEANIKASDIQEVLLTGWMTRMPKIQEVVQSVFGKEPSIFINPEHAIVIGAGYKACLLSKHFDSKHYDDKSFLEAARKYLKENDLTQCCGKLWGSVTYVVRNFYSKLGINIVSHSAYKGLCYYAASFNPDRFRAIKYAFDIGQSCHTLFYRNAAGLHADILAEFCNDIENFAEEFAKINIIDVYDGIKSFLNDATPYVDWTFNYRDNEYLKDVCFKHFVSVDYCGIERFLYNHRAF